jgi:hypothetical protein
MSDFPPDYLLERTGLCGPSHGGGTFNDADHASLLHDQKRLTIERHLGALAIGRTEKRRGRKVMQFSLKVCSYVLPRLTRMPIPSAAGTLPA